MLVGIAAKYDALNFRLRSCAQDELVLIIAENSRGDSPVDLAERCEMLPAVIDLRMRRARAPLWRDDVAVLVALDSNVVDLVEVACSSSAHVDAMEAMEPPPRFENLSPQQEVEVFACYWLLALAPAWRSTLYTFSDVLYREVACAPRSDSLLRVALDVLVREWQEPEYRLPDPGLRPATAQLISLGLKSADAEHVVDAIGLRCDRFLTNDRRLRNRSDRVERRWSLALRRPSEFLTEAVRDGAPWTTRAPWPWETIDRLRRGRPCVGAPA